MENQIKDKVIERLKTIIKNANIIQDSIMKEIDGKKKEDFANDRYKKLQIGSLAMTQSGLQISFILVCDILKDDFQEDIEKILEPEYFKFYNDYKQSIFNQVNIAEGKADISNDLKEYLKSIKDETTKVSS